MAIFGGRFHLEKALGDNVELTGGTVFLMWPGNGLGSPRIWRGMSGVPYGPVAPISDKQDMMDG